MQFRTRSLFVVITLAALACAILTTVIRFQRNTNQPKFAIQNYGENSLNNISIKITSSSNGKSQLIEILNIAPYETTVEPISVLGDIAFVLEYDLNGERLKLKNQEIRLWPDATFVVTVNNGSGTTVEGYW